MPNNLLQEVSFFNGLPQNILDEINTSLKPRELVAGELIFNLGDPGDELIIVQKGKIAIFTPDPASPASGKPIRIFEPGQFLGEMALIDQKPRSQSARAEESSTILALDGKTFRSLISSYPEIASNAMSGLSEKIRYTTEFINQVFKWTQRITDGNYSAGQFDQEMEAWMENTKNSSVKIDKSLITLAAQFAEMMMKIKRREEELREQIEQLKIEIDQTKRKQEVQQIMGSDYYQSLRDRVKKLRQNAAQDTDNE